MTMTKTMQDAEYETWFKDQLIHLTRVPTGVCEQKDKAARRVAQELSRPFDRGRAIATPFADHTGNVTCPRCKAWMKADKPKRERMRKPDPSFVVDMKISSYYPEG
jgi:hypothetical protein